MLLVGFPALLVAFSAILKLPMATAFQRNGGRQAAEREFPVLLIPPPKKIRARAN